MSYRDALDQRLAARGLSVHPYIELGSACLLYTSGRADGGVVGQQHDGLALAVEVLEGGFLADADSGDLALLHLGLAADADNVAVADGGGLSLIHI